MHTFPKTLATALLATSSVAFAGVINVDDFDTAAPLRISVTPSAAGTIVSGSGLTVSTAPSFGGIRFNTISNSNGLELSNGATNSGSVTARYAAAAAPAGISFWQVIYTVNSANTSNPPQQASIVVDPGSTYTFTSNIINSASGLVGYSSILPGSPTAFSITLTGNVPPNGSSPGADIIVDNIKILYSCTASPISSLQQSIGGGGVNGSALSAADGCATVSTPASLALLGLGFAGLATLRRKKV